MLGYKQYSVVAMLALLTGVSVSESAAPPMISQVVAAATPIKDEFGVTVTGTDPDADFFGIPVVEGDLVQVLLSADGNIYPPSADGTPDARTTVIATTRIGAGVSPNIASSGKFGCILTPRPGGGSPIFVRVFNAPTAAAASFYADSQIFIVSSTQNDRFFAQFTSGMQPLDTIDNDEDGVINSWEKSYGSNPDAIDSDGDSLTDADEVLAGTDLTDADSHFAVSRLEPANGDMILVWDTIPNRIYSVEKCVLGNGTYEVIESRTGDGNEQELLIETTAGEPLCFYRIRVSEISVE